MSPTRRALNASTVLPPGLLRKLQDRVGPHGVLLYIPARRDMRPPSETITRVQTLTTAGWTAAQIAETLGLSVRQVYRLRREARMHPERLIVLSTLPVPAPPPVPASPPAVARPAPRAPRRRRPTTTRSPSPATLARRRLREDRRRQEHILQGEWIGEGPPQPVEIERVNLRPVPLDRTDW